MQMVILLNHWYLSLGLFSSTVLQTFNVGKQSDNFDALVSTSTFNIYLTLMALPGMWNLEIGCDNQATGSELF